jgi:amino acid permease
MGAYCAYWTMKVLMDVAFKVNKNNLAHVVDEVLGKRAGMFLHIIFILTTYGMIVIYIITISIFIPQIITQFGMDETIANSELTRKVIIISLCIMMLPLFL